MKTFKRSALLTFCLALNLGLFSTAHALESVELTGQLTSAVGSQGQNFKTGFGVSGAFYFDRLIDPAIANYVSIGYNTFTLKTDDSTKFNVFPILAGIEFRGKVFSDFQTTFGVAAGGAIAYIGATGAGANINANGYFAAQIKPGFHWMLGDGFALVARTPVTFLVGKSSMTYLIYDLGVQFKL